MYFIMNNKNNKVGNSNEEFTECCNEAVDLHEGDGGTYRVFKLDNEEVWSTTFLYESDTILYINFASAENKMRVAF